jgi:hypothetical protein
MVTALGVLAVVGGAVLLWVAITQAEPITYLRTETLAVLRPT